MRKMLLEDKTGAVNDEVYMKAREILRKFFEGEMDITDSDQVMQVRIAKAYMGDWIKQYSASRSMQSMQFQVYQYISADSKEVKKRIQASMPHLLK